MARYPVKEPPAGYFVVRHADGSYVPMRVVDDHGGEWHSLTVLPEPYRGRKFSKRADAVKYLERVARELGEVEGR